MGGQTKRKDSKGGEKAQKRKRRKKARTDVSSGDSSNEDEAQVSRVKGDTLMEDAPALHTAVEVDDDENSEHEAVDESAAGKFTGKGGRIPSPLRDLHDPQADAKFEEYYMRLTTEEFGDNLNSVREAKDFNDLSLPMLVRALRQGVNIFDASEKRAVVKEMT